MRTDGTRSRSASPRRALAILVMVLAAAATFPTHAAPDAPINLNTATAEQLTDVPGIGTALASRIVEFRDQNGPFERVDDLLKVRGIGERSLEKLRPYVTVGERS